MGFFAGLFILVGIGLALWSFTSNAIAGSQLAALSTASFALAIALGVWRGVEVLHDIYQHVRTAVPISLDDDKYIAKKKQQREDLTALVSAREAKRNGKKLHPNEYDDFSKL